MSKCRASASTSPFTQVGDFTGPYPSADTAIMIDTAARLGAKTCYITAFGDDKFGDVMRKRLSEDGVDISHSKVLKGYHPAVVFVRYNSDGSREYLSTGGGRRLTPDVVDAEVVKSAKWVHFSGEVVNACQTGEEHEALMKVFAALEPGQMVSLDPNDGYDLDGFVEMMAPFVARANLILPSEGEAKTLIGAKSDEEACKLWLRRARLSPSSAAQMAATSTAAIPSPTYRPLPSNRSTPPAVAIPSAPAW